MEQIKKTVRYHHIESYPMKCRMYLSSNQKEMIEEWFLGLHKAYNMTLYALKTGDRSIMNQGKPSKEHPEPSWFPDFYKMSKKKWLDHLRSENEHVRNVPAAALSSSVGGIFHKDMKKAWESQGRLPADLWFEKRDARGHSVIRWYNDTKKRNSVYMQISTSNIQKKGKSVFVRIPKIDTVKLRGWNDRIKADALGKDSLFDRFTEEKKQLGFQIIKDRCGDFYGIISLRDVYRPFREAEGKRDVGVDVGIRNLMADSDSVIYRNPHVRKNTEPVTDDLRRSLSVRSGPANSEYRKERSRIKKWNKEHCEEIEKGTEEEKTIAPSKRYLKAQKKISRLERKATRIRELAQHEHSARIVSKASLIGIETLNVSGMAKDTRISKPLSEAAMSAQLQKLKYKAKWSGVPIQETGAFFPSTQICSECGYELQGNERLKIGAKSFTCPVCGYTADSDINAAKNLRARARYMYDNGIKPQEPEKSRKEYKDSPVSKKKEDKNIVVHFDPSMREKFRNPFVIMDRESGEVLDDAQGEGYRTVQKAKKAWRYRKKGLEEDGK